MALKMSGICLHNVILNTYASGLPLSSRRLKQADATCDQHFIGRRSAGVATEAASHCGQS